MGILLVPMVFAWYTLRRGHSALSRTVSFAWATVSLATVMVVCAAFAALVAGRNAQREARINAVAAMRSGASASATPDELAAAYREGEAGRARYAGRIITVTGMVESIVLRRAGIEMTLSGAAGGRVLASMPPAVAPLVADLERGSIARVTCITITHVIERPILMGCMPRSADGAAPAATPADPATIV